MKIAVFGLGYVGTVSAGCLAELGHEVIGVDLNSNKVNLINDGRAPIVETGINEKISNARSAGQIRSTTDPLEAISISDVSLVSVGTPSSPSGTPSFSALDAVISDIGSALRSSSRPHSVFVRSTIPPGTMEERVIPALTQTSGRKIGAGLEICYNPEFLREGTAVKDFFSPPYTIGGCANDASFELLKILYDGIKAPVIRTEYRVAESIKYVSNAFHAVKIIFANEVGTLLKNFGVDTRETMRLFCDDHVLNISAAYLRPGFAFGGSCLPKELRTLESLARSCHTQLPMISQVLTSNQFLIQTAFEMIERHGRSKVAFFGLAFKPGTDDLRESPLVTLAERLIGKGYDLAIFDREVQAARLVGSNREYIHQEIPHFERLMTTDPTETLENAKIIVIGHAGSEEIAAICANKDNCVIIDLQGISKLEALSNAKYEGICW